MSPRERGESPAPDNAAPAPIDLPEHAAARLRLRLVAAVLAAEAVGLFVFATFLLANLIGGSEETTETRNTVIETVAFFVIAGVLALLSRGCWRGRRWARAPVLVAQLIALFGIGANLVQGDLWYGLLLGVPLCVGSALSILALVTPAVTAVLEQDRD